MPDFLRELWITLLLLFGVWFSAYSASEPGTQILPSFIGGACLGWCVMMLRNDIKKAAKGKRF